MNFRERCKTEFDVLKKRLPEVTVFLLCMIISCIFISQKQGYHQDELLSFEMANAYYTPWVTPTQPEGRMGKFIKNEIKGENFGETLSNIGFIISDTITKKSESIVANYKADVYDEPVWFDRDIFTDYLTVDDGAFSFTSAYWNIKDDNHPPVHVMLLHLVSSLFRGRINPWMGCIINLIFMLGTVSLLMATGSFVGPKFGFSESESRWIGVFTAVFYCLSWGAVATVLLIRMYCILTFFVVASLYVHLKIYNDTSDPGKYKYGKLLTAVTALGFLTQYFFLFHCLILALVFFICLMHTRQYDKAKWYVVHMIVAAVIGIAVFPFAIDDVLHSGRGVEALEKISGGFGGYFESIKAFWGILNDATFTFGILLIYLLLWFFIVSLNVGHTSHRGYIYGSLIGIPAVGYFLLASRMAPFMVDRYIMAVFPIVILMSVIGLYGFMRFVKVGAGGRVVCISVLLIFSVFKLLHYNGEYLYKGYDETLDMADKYRDLSCICVYDGGFYDNLLEFTYYEKTLMVTVDELSDYSDLDSIEALQRVLVIVNPHVESEEVRSIMEKYGFSENEQVLAENINGDSYYLYYR